MAKSEWRRFNSRGKAYTSWERANIAYSWAYPDVGVIPMPLTSDDDEGACEQAVDYFLSIVDEGSNSHPTKRMHPDKELRKRAFDAKYPRPRQMTR